MRISFIGGGVMAEAIIGGILDAGLAASQDIQVGEPVERRRSHLADKYGLDAQADNMDVLAAAEIIVLSVKPQDLPKIMGKLSSGLNAKHVVLSIVAGTRLDTLIDGLKHPAVIRVMPNAPAQIGAGMTVWTASPDVGQNELESSRDILRTLGKEIYVSDEKLVDMATALSASGPAYVFLFIEALIDSGVYVGMPRDMSRKLVLETILGSTRLMKESGQHPAELRDLVTSPGGTTAEALLVFENEGFRGMVIDAVAAAYQKAIILGQKS